MRSPEIAPRGRPCKGTSQGPLPRPFSPTTRTVRRGSSDGADTRGVGPR